MAQLSRILFILQAFLPPEMSACRLAERREKGRAEEREGEKGGREEGRKGRRRKEEGGRGKGRERKKRGRKEGRWEGKEGKEK